LGGFFSENTKALMATAKHREDVIVLLLSQGYIKLETQENPGWGTFISGKKKCRICLLSSPNGSDCAFLTTRLERAEMHLRSHSNESKSRNIELDRVLEKLKQKERKNNIAFKRNSVKENLEV
jgi:hypothetical protein